MFDGKMKDEKVEMVKRIIRQNSYHQYEKTHSQCLHLGLNVNRSALDRFANKLELIDKAILSKRQQELHKLEQQERKSRQKQKSETSKSAMYQQEVYEPDFSGAAELESRAPAKQVQRSAPAPKPSNKQAKQRSTSTPARTQHVMSYEQVKQRETEITFALGELKIRENELLQELISLTEMLDSNQVN